MQWGIGTGLLRVGLEGDFMTENELEMLVLEDLYCLLQDEQEYNHGGRKGYIDALKLAISKVEDQYGIKLEGGAHE